MLKALPILIILGLAIYSFFDVLKTPDLLIKRGPKAMWVVLALVPVIGAALWFLLGRPGSESDAHPPPRVIGLRRGQSQVAPDDDPKFLRRLDDEVWMRKREEARSRERSAKAGGNSTSEPSKTSKDATPESSPDSKRPSPDSEQSSPAADDVPPQSSEGTTDRKSQSEEQTPGEQDL